MSIQADSSYQAAICEAVDDAPLLTADQRALLTRVLRPQERATQLSLGPSAVSEHKRRAA